ncbi:MAG: sulfatase, partial [Planctomycetes bacterium]|nr:sulfatase [Planctomycetota bacterium]
RTSSIFVSNYDLFPTLLSYVGLKDRIPGDPPRPGRDYSPILRGENLEWEDVVFYEFENCRMVRTERWKYTRRHPSGPHELYDLEADPGEKVNLAGSPGAAEAERRLLERLEAFFARHADPKYDLWRGGGSKSHLLLSPAPPLVPGKGR